MALIDQQQRVEATNPRGSYIVQAPAGSGKTEILTQRYLRLLGTVQHPEQIVALTFTRKAASEMRERIYLALEQAAQQVEAKSAHQQMTLQFAKEALARSEALGWNILSQPQRMRVTTIDSLCQSINQSIPLVEHHLSFAQITDRPDRLYLKAARQCIEMAMQEPEYQPALETLLLHLDNRQDKLVLLFQSLLAQRDQWLGPLFEAKAQDRALFESALKHIETHEIQRLQHSLPFFLAQELVDLSRTMAILENNGDSKRAVLSQWQDFEAIVQDIAQALCALILKSDGELRSAFDHHVGLKKDQHPKEVYTSIKDRSKTLLSQLQDYPQFIESLVQVSTLPKPRYDEDQWRVLQALFQLLPILVGHLQVLFGEQNTVDFAAVAQSALAALGSDDEPTELTLYLDHSIHHLLVDEFQDTSISQFELLSRLVQGWLPDDGRTLFLVGDPMQSIYRFRQAEVGLFYQVQEQGIGPVRLKLLQLACNFRSTQTIIDWVNQHFGYIFPHQFDIESGAVSFHPSVHVLPNTPDSMVHAMECGSKSEEADELARLLKKELALDDKRSIAILVRSRSHLPEIIRCLREHGIPYQGSDIDLLSNLPHVNDLWTLTQALLYPANRLAWLSLLRSPLVGLTLADMHVIARHRPYRSIYESLHDEALIQSLSPEGALRATYAKNLMGRALTERHHHSLSLWVESTFKSFQGELLLSESQRNDIEQFYALLEAYDASGRIEDIEPFENELKKLYAQQSSPSRIQVMTIHKSKGLEFDTVILPALGAAPNRPEKPLMRWLTLPTHQQNILLISPVQAAHEASNALYDYLGDIDNEKAAYEAQRLLYVAATRAKSRLILLDKTTKRTKGSFKSLLKHQEFITLTPESEEAESQRPLPPLYRLKHEYLERQATTPVSATVESAPKLKPNPQRIIGTITHQLLQWICENHPASLSQVPLQMAAHQLRLQGFSDDEVTAAMSTITHQLQQWFQDSKAQWIMQPHEQQRNEYELLIYQNERVTTRIIDRTFVADGIQWIIDFKTGQDTPDALQAHKKQLDEYALLLRDRTKLPIHCGLYYLETGRWTSWV